MVSDENIHATAVALTPDRGVLILGPPGSGKSELALRLMAFGATLVADDRVDLTARSGELWARAPAVLSGMIEMRGVGILRATPLPAARIVLAVDLGQPEPERLPPDRICAFQGITLPLVLGQKRGHLDAAVLQWLKCGRVA